MRPKPDLRMPAAEEIGQRENEEAEESELVWALKVDAGRGKIEPGDSGHSVIAAEILGAEHEHIGHLTEGQRCHDEINAPRAGRHRAHRRAKRGASPYGAGEGIAWRHAGQNIRGRKRVGAGT